MGTVGREEAQWRQTYIGADVLPLPTRLRVRCERRFLAGFRDFGGFGYTADANGLT